MVCDSKRLTLPGGKGFSWSYVPKVVPLEWCHCLHELKCLPQLEHLQMALRVGPPHEGHEDMLEHNQSHVDGWLGVVEGG